MCGGGGGGGVVSTVHMQMHRLNLSLHPSYLFLSTTNASHRSSVICASVALSLTTETCTITNQAAPAPTSLSSLVFSSHVMHTPRHTCRAMTDRWSFTSRTTTQVISDTQAPTAWKENRGQWGRRNRGRWGGEEGGQGSTTHTRR